MIVLECISFTNRRGRGGLIINNNNIFSVFSAIKSFCFYVLKGRASVFLIIVKKYIEFHIVYNNIRYCVTQVKKLLNNLDKIILPKISMYVIALI